MKMIPSVYADKNRLAKNSVNGFLQNVVTIPLSQEAGFRCACVVKKGDVVREGDVIGYADSGESPRSRAKIHASVPGVVEDIISCACPDGMREEAVRIRTGGAFSYLGKKLAETRWKSFYPALIAQQLAEKGVVNTFDTSRPVSLALEIERLRPRLLVVRLYDDDPSRVTDSVLYAAHPDEIQVGAFITARAAGAGGIVFALDKKSPLPVLENEGGAKDAPVPVRSVRIDIAKYPAGFRREMVAAVKKSLREEPFSSVSEEELFTDSATMLAVSRAIGQGVPLVEQYVHVSGGCLPASGLLKVRIGTTMRHLAEQCGGFTRSCAAVIINGDMLGSSCMGLDAPVTKYVKSVEFVRAGKISASPQTACTRCGRCRAVCTRKLSPDVLYRHAAGGMPAGEEYVRSALLCSGCGLCNSVCPARLPLCQIVRSFQNAKEARGI